MNIHWIHCIENFFTVQVFEQLALALKTEFALKFFTVLNIYFFIFPDFWATCACPENRVCPEIFQAGGRPPPHPPSYAYVCTCEQQIWLNLFAREDGECITIFFIMWSSLWLVTLGLPALLKSWKLLNVVNLAIAWWLAVLRTSVCLIMAFMNTCFHVM